MSEKIITLNSPQYCDICGRRMGIGERCRIIRDDFLPFIRFFEHLRCPTEAPSKQSAYPGRTQQSCFCNP